MIASEESKNCLVALLKAFSRVVHERREQLGMSQEQLADRAGMHRTYISDIERGARNLSLKNVGRLAEALEMKVSELILLAEERVHEDKACGMS